MWQLCLFTNSPVLHSGTTKAVKESWRQKLHLAKLAAWMKAKAQMEASDLASSLVPLMLPVKNTDDYDILPQGEDEKKTDDRPYTAPNDNAALLADVENLLMENQAMLENLETGSFQFFMNDSKTE